MTVFDTARAEAIGRVEAVCGVDEEVAAELIDELIAARSSTTCETCGGQCWRCDACEAATNIPSHCDANGEPRFHDGCSAGRGFGIWRACAGCDGSGTVPGGPLGIALFCEPAGARWMPGTQEHVALFRARETP